MTEGRGNLAPAVPPRQSDPDLAPMKRRIFSVSKVLGMSMDDAIQEAPGQVLGEDDLTFEQCRTINDWLTEEEKKT